MLAWARAHGLRPEACDDVAQEAFVRLLAANTQFPCRAAQVAWLRRVTSNLCVDTLRQARPLVLIDDRPSPALEAGISHEERRALADAIRQLPEMQRLVLVAKAVEEVTFALLAADLEISIPSAKTHYRRAVEALRQRLHSIAPSSEPTS